jgi:hypothetical protein
VKSATSDTRLVLDLFRSQISLSTLYSTTLSRFTLWTSEIWECVFWYQITDFHNGSSGATVDVEVWCRCCCWPGKLIWSSFVLEIPLCPCVSLPASAKYERRYVTGAACQIVNSVTKVTDSVCQKVKRVKLNTRTSLGQPVSRWESSACYVVQPRGSKLAKQRTLPEFKKIC